MIDAQLIAAILDSLKDPILFADTEHIVRYMNKAAIAHYSEDGLDAKDLLGTSLFDCHNEQSCAMMVEILAAMHEGEDERMITDNEKYRVYMRAVRDPEGHVLGYYERYAPPAQ